jgi:flagellar biosynthesis protein FlhF
VRIKRYEAEEEKLPLIMRQVRIDLGEDAVVKTRRFRKGGVLGFGARTYVEVVAGVDDTPVRSAAVKTRESPPVSIIPPRGIPAKPVVGQPRGKVSLRTPEDPELAKLRREVALLKDMLASGNEQAVFETAEDVPVITQTVEPDGMISCRDLRNRFMESEVADEVLAEILDGVVARLKESEPEAALVPTAREEAIEHIVQLLIERSAEHSRVDKRVLAFVGPTGVGKTTTLAKMAANFGMLDEHSFAIVTADTYRVAAVDQLRAYSQIMRVPLEVVHSPEEMSAAIANHDDKDFVFVDTAGRSPSNGSHLEDLRSILSSRDDIAAYLLLSATTRFRDMLHIRRAFEHPAMRGVVFTKIDETTAYGAMLSLLYTSRLPVCFLTNGQEVPEDIVLAEEDDLLRLIVKRCLS